VLCGTDDEDRPAANAARRLEHACRDEAAGAIRVCDVQFNDVPASSARSSVGQPREGWSATLRAPPRDACGHDSLALSLLVLCCRQHRDRIPPETVFQDRCRSAVRHNAVRGRRDARGAAQLAGRSSGGATASQRHVRRCAAAQQPDPPT